MSRPRRVLYAPRNISGQASEYAAAVASLGCDGEVWSFGEPAFGFPADRVLDRERMLTEPSYRWQVFDTAVRDYDVFHFQYSRSLLDPQGVGLPELWDLPLLKALGKRVFMHFRGSDVRLRSVHVQREPHSYFLEADVPCDEDRIHAKVTICRRFCDGLFVSTPGLLDYVPDAVWVPHVLDVDAWHRPRAEEPAVPEVAHIPSRKDTKGSRHIEPVLRALNEEGLCTYRPLSDLSRDDLRAALQRADIVVDSLTIGDHGLISVEAMAAGAIPVAHIHERNRERNRGVPVVEADVGTLEAVVRSLADDPERRRDLRARCLEWVRARHDRPVVGALLADAYRAPVSEPSLAYPGWLRSDSQQRVAALEEEVERLRADVAPLALGLGAQLRSAPLFIVERLVARIRELEQELATTSAGPESGADGRWPEPPRRGWRGVLSRYPRTHRFARRTAKRLLRNRR